MTELNDDIKWNQRCPAECTDHPAHLWDGTPVPTFDPDNDSAPVPQQSQPTQAQPQPQPQPQPRELVLRDPAIHEAFVMSQVSAERHRQDELWGVQDHLNGTGEFISVLDRTYEPHRLARHFKTMCQRSAQNDRVTWRHIFLEEAFEALAESDPTKLRTELIQVAAVAVQWVQAIDRAAVRDETATKVTNDRGDTHA